MERESAVNEEVGEDLVHLVFDWRISGMAQTLQNHASYACLLDAGPVFEDS